MNGFVAGAGLRGRLAMRIVLAMSVEKHDEPSSKALPKRTRRLHIRLTPREFQMLSFLSYDSEMSMSDFVRQLIRKEHERSNAADARLQAASEVLGVAERFVDAQRARH